VNAADLQKRTKRFAVRAVIFCRSLPTSWEARRIGGQLIDAATSVYANYRATCRARSRAEFIAKIGVVAEESDECVGWLELIQALELSRATELTWLLREAGELLAIFAKSQKTAKENRQGTVALNPSINRQPPNRQSKISEAPP
jgi:four helix bundle protein